MKLSPANLLLRGSVFLCENVFLFSPELLTTDPHFFVEDLSDVGFVPLHNLLDINGDI